MATESNDILWDEPAWPPRKYSTICYIGGPANGRTEHWRGTLPNKIKKLAPVKLSPDQVRPDVPLTIYEYTYDQMFVNFPPSLPFQVNSEWVFFVSTELDLRPDEIYLLIRDFIQLNQPELNPSGPQKVSP